jgi:hypothetical protein
MRAHEEVGAGPRLGLASAFLARGEKEKERERQGDVFLHPVTTRGGVGGHCKRS